MAAQHRTVWTSRIPVIVGNSIWSGVHGVVEISEGRHELAWFAAALREGFSIPNGSSIRVFFHEGKKNTVVIAKVEVVQ